MGDAPCSRSYESFRAPSANNGVLFRPKGTVLRELALARHAQVSAGDLPLTIGGIPQSELMAASREHLLSKAREWTQQYANPSGMLFSPPLILSGHQPELFHPGVWFKNFALGAIARSVQGVGIHLLIDSDLCRSASVRVPTGGHALRTEPVPYDTSQEPMPYEERTVAEERLLTSFAERVLGTLTPEIQNPLVGSLWPHAVAAHRRGATLGQALSVGRHQIELDHGNTTLELPFSTIGDSDPFRRFLAELLLRAGPLRDAYNGALASYRVAHRIRSPVQPLPDLGTTEGWIETPFWVWSNDSPRRHSLWVRVQQEQLSLTNRANWETTLEAHQPDDMVAQLASLRASGIKIRSRALATTLYCRLFLADLFLHGIGGAKYDQVTDDLARRFFGVAPPPHATLTATMRLFSPQEDEPNQAERRRLLHQLRAMRYHPEGWIPDGLESQAVATKRHWVAIEKTELNAAERHRSIDQANQAMRASLEAERRKVEGSLAELDERFQKMPLRTSREYAFCLFPRDSLIGRLKSLSDTLV